MAKIQLGLCCINTYLRKQNIFCSRKPIIKTISKKGLDVLYDCYIKNAEDLIKMIEWNYRHKINVFRISSELFPHRANPKITEYVDDIDLDVVQPLLDKAGALAKKYNQRLTFHPGQYNVIGSPNKQAFDQTLRELDYHAECLDRLGCDKDSIMVIHGGGLYGDKEATIIRWAENFYKLPKRVQARLVIENCERGFSIVDCLRISQLTNVPVVFDIHHFKCYNELHPDEAFGPAEQYIQAILHTWEKRGIKPKFHLSEQGPGRIGHHSDFIESIDNCLLEIPDKYNISIDIMIEAKMKELAIFKLYKKYPQIVPD